MTLSPDLMPETSSIRQMFDSIAPEYDVFNHLTSFGIDQRWRRRALKFVKGPQVLDAACGTGDFSIEIARRYPELKLTAVDISSGMLAKMKAKLNKAGLAPSRFAPDGTALNGVSAEIGDCCALKYADGSFDSVTVAFGVRNFEDKEKALSEIFRVLKPEGHFVMLELSLPGNRMARAAFKVYFTHVMPHIGSGLTHNRAAYRYLPASVMTFPKKREWMATLEKAGFRNIRHRSLSLGICRLYVAEKPSTTDTQ